MTIMMEAMAQRDAPFGALKILHAIRDRAAAEKARGRMGQELSALSELRHPSIVKIYEANPDEGWFVMEYFSGGTLADQLTSTRGNFIGALHSFRPLVQAVSELHKRGLVHRDIKPANIFIRDDGRLVLGDFGLVINPQAGDARLTDTYENVGSRDWMPGWAYGIAHG